MACVYGALTLLGALNVRSNQATAWAIFASTARSSLLILSTSPSPSSAPDRPSRCRCGSLTRSAKGAFSARGDSRAALRRGVLDDPEYPEEMLFGHVGSGFDADSVAQTCEALADESTWWSSGFGVVTSRC